MMRKCLIPGVEGKLCGENERDWGKHVRPYLSRQEMAFDVSWGSELLQQAALPFTSLIDNGALVESRENDNEGDGGPERWRGKRRKRQSCLLSLACSLYAPAPWQLFNWLRANIRKHPLLPYLVSPHSFTHTRPTLHSYHSQVERLISVLVLRLPRVPRKHWRACRVLQFSQCLRTFVPPLPVIWAVSFNWLSWICIVATTWTLIHGRHIRAGARMEL